MNTKDLKSEARSKLALNIHQAIAVYAVEFLLFITLIALVFMAVAAFGTKMKAAAIIMIFYGVALLLIMMIVSGIIGFAMTDFYLASYRCIPYNFRRLGDTIARGGIHKILVMNIIRTLLGFLLLLLLIVPGVIYLSRTAMANNLLIANPRMKAKEALKASSKVMTGKTGGYIALMLSMIGWVLLAILTLGLGFVFVLPYVNLVKTEYYKRNLQGDRNMYQVQPQPVAQMPVQNQQQYAQQQQYAAPAMQNIVPQQAAAPQNEEPQMQPISSVNDHVLDEINQTMREFNGDAVIADVPEVPLKPVSAAKAEGAEPIVQKPITKTLDDSDIVEIVRPLGTQEVEGNVIEQRINDMLAGKPKDASAKHDYFGGPKVQNANDFFTEETSPGDFADDFGIVEDGDKPADNVMSDEAFAEFLKDFDTNTYNAAEQADVHATDAPKVDPEVKPAASALKTDIKRPKTVTFAAETSEDRAARHRREREERLKQLRNGRK
ncbi:MAG: DUF975 family protein [Clostridiales bacterium]|nr:DUF975 family protein [Clostridiales bacterium]